MSSLNETVASLNLLGAEMSLLKHPFYQQWTAGTLSPQRLANYAIQYYRHVEAFPRYLTALHSRCDDLETRQVLLQNLIDEERGPENHPELWLRFAQAVGLNREEVLAAEPLPAAKALVSTFHHLSRDLPLSAGLSALYVYESQVAEVARTPRLTDSVASMDSQGMRRRTEQDSSRHIATPIRITRRRSLI
jgi:pyrroloquinoline-quinone synthase